MVRIKLYDDERLINVLSFTDSFDTPKDWTDFENWINKHDSFEERKKLMTVACMAWNLLKIK